MDGIPPSAWNLLVEVEVEVEVEVDGTKAV